MPADKTSLAKDAFGTGPRRPTNTKSTPPAEAERGERSTVDGETHADFMYRETSFSHLGLRKIPVPVHQTADHLRPPGRGVRRQGAGFEGVVFAVFDSKLIQAKRHDQHKPGRGAP